MQLARRYTEDDPDGLTGSIESGMENEVAAESGDSTRSGSTNATASKQGSLLRTVLTGSAARVSFDEGPESVSFAAPPREGDDADSAHAPRSARSVSFAAPARDGRTRQIWTATSSNARVDVF